MYLERIKQDLNYNISIFKKNKPFRLNELVIDEKLKEKFFYMITEKKIPNLLFTGPPGSGKTSGGKYCVFF
jgi:replication-associated recombination protein RarA